MEIDPSEGEYSKEAALLSQITTNSPLSSSVAKLSGSSRGIPYEKDFHFYKNFAEFKDPVKEIDEKSKTLLERIGVSSQLWGKGKDYPSGLVIDDFDGYDWLVDLNDDVLEKLDASIDEFKVAREADSGFQVVKSRKNKRAMNNSEDGGFLDGLVQVAAKPKPKIPFHIPSIPRPQDEYKILVNNMNQPFEHVWLQRSEDGTRFIHPLENCSVLDFVDKNISSLTPKKPEPLQSTPFKLVQDVKDLKHLAAKLKSVDEFAVDLEHNQYRSFQGLTCLMQISTRTEDFIIDTLKLRIHVGPYLREVFKDPTKKKVMHGADRDIVWLQRDFGIYVCNLFDTGQASRVLKLERNSLEYLLHHFCGVTANKEYQNADWRLRPLPAEMVRYAREDTHYLLYIYDLMRIRLASEATDSESADPPLVEVYKRSYDICTQLYEKELLTESSFLHIYGLQDAGFNAQQLSVVAGLCEWRDVVARAEDESTGFVLPNKTLLEIGISLRRSLKSKHPYIDRNLASVLNIIRHSMKNASAFEEVAEQLKQRHTEKAIENSLVTEGSEVSPSEFPELAGTMAEAVVTGTESKNTESQSLLASTQKQNKVLQSESSTIGVTVQVQKKPNRAFGALLGGSGKRRNASDRKEDSKLEQIKSSVNLPFHTFVGSEEGLHSMVELNAMPVDNPHREEPMANGAEDFISLVKDSANTGAAVENESMEDDEDKAAAVENESMENEEDKAAASENESAENKVDKALGSSSDVKDGDETSALRAGFEKLATKGFLQIEPFDYEAARKQVIFGEDPGRDSGPGDADHGRNRIDKADKRNSSFPGDLPQGRRRQAFPSSGNRSATFR
ncbi:OLC1v1036074C1 [Oldenlandia corymbosa var. corymbosa]|uniref:OLC1v1036074C1 n=1 Tax=Oldenlandia corymbosa var. corymbosa TaxID=529605 RepID=A0AAV1CV93_OLDCO|nr:OLC1v1036074C1 [Oldenlandia corymbosa var. corymbosa]